MTTARDLLITALDKAPVRPVEQGDLSLALAGAEVIDLLGTEAVGLDGDRIVPNGPPVTADRMLDQAATSLVRQTPYESVAEWLWRRGRGLSVAYLADLEAEGQITREPCRRWLLFRTTRVTVVDSSARGRAEDRWAAEEPVLASLAASVGLRDEQPGDSPGVADDAVQTVLDAVDEAVGELAAERQRRVRRREEAAANNRMRGW
ncbi:GPP34 family phosphoprotein [Streptomyces sp. RB6PN25]|uniref:GPP34 family phosphoprotein n=1 Tax=Streptomyces humicola TaxID=2953240 RepID=A0ABT1PW92_9ACTN|nr:GPP34 family phosphoprotein [Streptomyces humicola]MCQ4081941.1 GPP34 family phosphoprotein [Streptomyces humicola]